MVLKSTQFHRYANVIMICLLGLAMAEGGVTCSTYMKNAKRLDSFENTTMLTNNGIAGGEYLPANTDLNTVQQLYPSNQMPKTNRPVTISNCIKQDTKISFHAESKERGKVISPPLFSYPYYALSATQARKATPTLTSTNGNTNLLTVSIPSHHSGSIEVAFKKPRIRKAATWLSTLIVLAVFGYLMTFVKNPHKTRILLSVDFKK